MADYPLIGCVLRGPRGGPHRTCAEYEVVDVRPEDNGYGRLVEFAHLRRLDSGARTKPPGSTSRVAVSALGKYRVIGRTGGDRA